MALLNTFGIFAAGYVIRPVGALMFGHIGDRLGRKVALTWSMLLMAFATVAIGLLPTYQTWGMAAPAVLLFLRLLQGLAIAGEYNGAAVFLVEHAKNRYPTLTSSWVGTSAAAGMVLGGLAAAIVTHPIMPEWAWRVPFLLGALGCVLAFYLRRDLKETPDFTQAEQKQRLVTRPLLHALKFHKLALMQTAVFAALVGIMVYVSNIYFNTYLIEIGGLPAYKAAWAVTFGQACIVLIYPIMGWLGDVFSPKKVVALGLIWMMIISPVVFALGQTGHFGYALLAQGLYSLANAMGTAPMFRYLIEQFPAEVRYSGYSFAWSVSIALFGGTAPLFAHWLVTAQNWPLAPGWYISVTALIALLTILKK